MGCDKTGIDIITQIDDKVTAAMAKKSGLAGSKDTLLGEVYNLKREVVNSGMTGDDLKDEVVGSANEVVGTADAAVSQTDGILECAGTLSETCGGAGDNVLGAAGKIEEAIELAKFVMDVASNSSMGKVINGLAGVAAKYVSKLKDSGLIDDLIGLDGLFTCADGFPNIDPEEIDKRMEKINKLEEDLWVTSDGVDEKYIDEMAIEAGNFGDDVKSVFTDSLTSTREAAAKAAEDMKKIVETDVEKTNEAKAEVKRPGQKLF